MPLVPGLSPNVKVQTYEEPEDDLEGDDGDIEVGEADEGGDKPNVDDNGNILSIEHEDGSITISLDGTPLNQAEEDDNPEGWFENLANKISPSELTSIAEDLLRDIEDDVQSRQEWIQDRAQGIRLLGLKLELPNVGSTGDGAPVEGMSKVRHPLLLEAVLRFQANARSELLPTDGPVKIRDDSTAGSIERDQMADALQRDMNHYLTSVDKSYYPDTDKMLLMLGFGGCSFKKVYNCPLRNRPVSETVDAENLIVNNSATSLADARRITHQVFLSQNTVRRMQLLKVYRDIELGDPKPYSPDEVKRERSDQQGVAKTVWRTDERDREIYECYCELNITGFEHKMNGKATGLELPYRVTIDVSSREILSIVRNYDEPEEGKLPEARQNFVKYTFVPGLGFYDIGLLHILGNTTNAVTAAWREILDAGMFANFPGFLMADAGGRQNTNIFRVPPGGGAIVNTGGMPINQAVMPLPYKEAGPGLVQAAQAMAETGQRVGGTADIMVGEGRQDAPVGTTLAMIEQAIKVMSSVHKRLCTAQAEEFALLVRCFRENPEAFWRQNKLPSMTWNEQTFMKALDDNELVPQADPNTASHVQRIMKAQAIKMLQKESPTLYDPIAVDMMVLQTLGVSNPQSLMVPTEALGRPSPEQQAQEAALLAQHKIADAKVAEVQQKGAKLQLDAQAQQMEQAKVASQIEKDRAQAQATGLNAQTQRDKLALDEQRLQNEAAYAEQELIHKEQDRLSKERIQLIDVAQNIAVHPYSAGLVQPLLEPAMAEQVRLQNEIEQRKATAQPPRPRRP